MGLVIREKRVLVAPLLRVYQNIPRIQGDRNRQLFFYFFFNKKKKIPVLNFSFNFRISELLPESLNIPSSSTAIFFFF